VLALLKQWLELPEMRGLDLDDPSLTDVRIGIIRRKAFLRKLYEEWYDLLVDARRRAPPGIHVEIGSGAGFLRERMPDVITSEVVRAGDVEVVFSAETMPFGDASLAGIYMVDVLHHIPRPRAFFAEAVRCLKPGGRVAMIEPWNSAWGRFVWQNAHHEAFLPDADWELPGRGPLSDANIAAPWIVFVRDRSRFAAEFPELHLSRLSTLMPFTYLLTGGFRLRSLLPGALYGTVRGLERLMTPLNKYLGMFAFIELERMATTCPAVADSRSGLPQEHQEVS
jgi:SAM-dependent methyltransferase